MKYTFDQYKRIFEVAVAEHEAKPFFTKLIDAHGRPAFPADRRQVAVFGIRHEGKTSHGREDQADDMISLARLDSDGLPQVYEYLGTTESGLFKEVVNPLGDFKMNPGFYFFKLGLHKGTSPCLVQAAPVIGERAKKETDYDETDDKTWQIDDGSLHIHAGILNVNHVGNWSAGCQVIAGGWEGAAWKEFYGYCKIAPSFPVPYVLVNEADIPGYLA
jgi:hypothetical protein